MTISPNKWELDVQGYLNVCNISAATPRQQIRDFAKGVNDLGLWNSMVCWPLRSSQNYGSGTTAFSLGGLGTFNGTLTNGPTWGADGITNSATGHITTNYFEQGGAQAHIFVGNSTTASETRCLGSTLSNLNTKGIRFRDDGVLWGDGELQFAPRDFTNAGSFKMAAAFYNRPAASFNYLNTSQGTGNNLGGAVVAGENSLTLLGFTDSGASGQYYSGQASFYGTIAASVTTAQYLAIYTLYSTTLGTGLGLP
jgi:hypothetical protein